MIRWFEKYSDWIDIACHNRGFGEFYFIQMRYNLNTNEKIFREVKIAKICQLDAMDLAKVNSMKYGKGEDKNNA